MIGSAGKKIQTIVELAEELYERTNEIRRKLQETSETVETTADRVERLEVEVAEQRAIVEAIATDHGVDVEAVADSVSMGRDEAESDGDGQPSG